MNTIEKLGEEETFRNIVEHTITEFEDNEIKAVGQYAFYFCSKLTSASFPVATSIGTYAFYFCSKLTSASFPVATSIGHSAFSNCSELTNASFQVATSIGNSAFSNCSKLPSASFPVATSIGSSAFESCSALTSASFPVATSIGNSAFRSCSALTSALFPVAASINYGTFQYCSALTSASFPAATSIDTYAFSDCSELKNVSFPVATSIGGSAFQSCSKLTSVSFPVATSIGQSAFGSCSALTSASFPAATSIGTYAFNDCSELTALYIGIESDTVCTLSSTNAIPSNVTDIYVPVELVDSYKTATNWSSFADKIKSYEVPVSCQSLTITAEDVPGYRTSTIVHYEAICTYSAGGIMQTGTEVFKGDAVSDTFGTNPSGESSRQVEVSYTFLGQTATTTITQDKYLGNPVGGKIYYIDDTADGTYEFYDAEGNLMSDVSVGSTPSYYKVLTAGSKDKYYVYHDELYNKLQWGKYKTETGATGTAIGTGKSNTAILLATDAVTTTNTIWYKLQQIRNASTGGCDDWFIPSRLEIEELRKAIGFQVVTPADEPIILPAGKVTGGVIAGTADGQAHYKDYNSDNTRTCYPSETKFLTTYIWSSSEYSSQRAWDWYYPGQNWDTNSKDSSEPVFFARAF